MSAWMVVLWALGYVFGGGFVLCGLLALAYAVSDWLRKLRRKHHGPAPGWRCEDCDDMRQHMRDRPDCAESCCWDLRLDELVAGFDWDAAEAEFERRRP